MMTSTYKKKITDLLNRLCHNSDRALMIRIFVAAKAIVTLAEKLEDKSIRRAMETMAAEQDRRLCALPAVDDVEWQVALVTLCEFMRETELHKDHTLFFTEFVPFMVAQWPLVNKEVPDTEQQLELLGNLFEATQKIVGTSELFNHISDDYFEEIQAKSPWIDADMFEVIWNAVFFYSGAVPDLKSDHVRKAVRLYANQNKSKEHLLADYLLELKDMGQKPIHFSSSSEVVQKLRLEGGLKKGEILDYYTAPKLLTQELPAKVLQHLYYQNKSDAFADSVLSIQLFGNYIGQAQKPIVINPSPMFLHAWKRLKLSIPRLVAVVPTRKFGIALSPQYPDIEFWSFEEMLECPAEADLILFFGGNKEWKYTPNALELLACLTPGPKCTLIAYLPSSALKQKKAELCQHLKEKGFAVSQMITVPGKLVDSTQKTILVGYKSTISTGELTGLPSYDCLYNKAKDMVTLAHTAVKTKKTLSEALSVKEVANPHSPGALLPWSNEIVVSHADYPVRDANGNVTRIRSKAYIRKADDLNPEKRGNAIKGTQTEQGLRAESEDELRQKLYELPLRKDLYMPIRNDIVRVYGNCPEKLSLKTVWFCLRPYLMEKDAYDDELAQILFCGAEQALANLRFSASYEEFCQALLAVLETNAVPQDAWTLLNQIADKGGEFGFLESNPLDEFWPAIEKESKAKVYRVQESLRKWCFTDEEMDRMFDPLIEMQAADSIPHALRRYVCDSGALLKLCALFSFIRKAELISLRFGDIEDLPNGGAQVRIRSAVDEHDNIIQYTGKGATRRRRRKSALPPVLAHCIRQRREWLQRALGLSDEEISEIPIFLEEEPRGKQKVQRCSYKRATTLYKELLKAAKVPEDKRMMLEGKLARLVDFGLTRKTESNFSNSFRILASWYGLEDGEVSYNAGVEPESTLDSHYIAYDAPQNQIATSAKMHRATAKYFARILPAGPATRAEYFDVSESVHRCAFEPTANQKVHLYTNLQFTKPTGSSINISVRTNFGHKMTIVAM